MKAMRSRLTYANVMVTILTFIVLSGGTALASYVISSNSQVGPGTISGHKPPAGDHANVISGSLSGQDLATGAVSVSKIASGSVVGSKLAPSAVTTAKVLDDSLTGADINESTLNGSQITGVDAATVGGKSATN